MLIYTKHKKDIRYVSCVTNLGRQCKAMVLLRVDNGLPSGSRGVERRRKSRNFFKDDVCSKKPPFIMPSARLILLSCTTHPLVMHDSSSCHARLILLSCTTHPLVMHDSSSCHARLILLSCTTHPLVMHDSSSCHARLILLSCLLSCHLHDSVRLFYRHFKPYQASHFNITLFMSDIERLLETRTFQIIVFQHLTLSISPSLKQLSLDLSI